MSGILPFLKGMLFPLFHRADLARWKATERVLAFDDLTPDKSGPEPVAIAADDLAVLQYTGGTTGTPKGAMLTHANIAANTSQLRLIVTGLQPGEERVLGLLPLSHVFAMTVVMNVAVSAGAEMILLPRFDLKGLLRTIHQQRPTVFPGVPTVYAAINEFPDLRRYDLSSIRYCISGGAALPPDVQARFEAITGCHLVEGYGLSETSPVAISNLLNGGSRAGSVGLPVPGTHVEIRSLEDRSVAQPPGEPGEIAIRGPQVMRGYWKRPDATAKALVDGWFFTGDVGHMDADGFTFLVDRIKDVIVRDGYKVYPRVIEEAIRAHPAVADVTVIGVPDAIRGAFPKAFVRLVKAGAVTVDELRSFLVERLSPLETPKEFEFRTRLPRTNVGKPARKELLEEELAARARGGG
jgi:long-chain acyl-CoA synthetase